MPQRTVITKALKKINDQAVKIDDKHRLSSIFAVKQKK
jgi:hypothetical protein